MSEYRKIILDAQILARSPDEIAKYIEGRSKDNSEDSGADFEAKLLCLGDRRIDLALAQNCIFAETAQSLFFRNAEDIPLRLSILSNEKVGSWLGLYFHIPYALFPVKSDTFEAYIGSASENEFHAIFNNEAIDRDFVSDFFEGRRAWDSMNEDRRVLAIRLGSGPVKLLA